MCPAHSKQRIQGNGKKYYLHLLYPEQLEQRGISVKKAQLIINAYPVMVLSNELLEELFCQECGNSRWCRRPPPDEASEGCGGESDWPEPPNPE